MTTRDPRSRDVPSPTSPGSDGVREPTQSLHLGPDDEPASLALGTHNRPVTRVESPVARGRTSAPAPRPAPSGSRRDDPEQYVDAVLGSYRVLALLGKGGMGTVFRAEHVKLGREVALKVLRNDYASRRDAVARFFQEARTVNRVRHRNIVDVTDFVELDDGTTYIVMELLTGTSLGAWAQDGVEAPRALAVLVQICDGLAAAHDVGVVHRDLKPDNVMVVPTSDGADLVKLLDFGVAKLVNREDEDVGIQTAAGSVIGTPAYMSPEQAGGMAIDARSDIYSLGAIMYELFSGQPMFRGRSFGEYVRKHLTEMPVPPSQTPGGAGIDPRLEALILRCLDKDPDQRFSTIGELRDTLLHLLGGMALRPSAPGLSTSGLRAVTPLPALSGATPQPHTPPPSAAVVTSLPPPLPPPPEAPAPYTAAAHDPYAGAMPQRFGPESIPYPDHVPSDLGSPGYAMPQSTTAPAHAAAAQTSPHADAHARAPMFLTDRDFAPPVRAATPPWLWFAGGALTVGIGVAAAIWFAGRGDVDRAPATAAPPSTAASTTPQPPDPPAAPPAPPGEPAQRPGLIEVRFDSSPSGSVRADGSQAELCRTPCAFDIDLSDGGPTDRRSFVVRRAGYQDSPVVVDLTASRREFAVTLQPDARAHDASPPTKATPDRRPKRSLRVKAKDPIKDPAKDPARDRAGATSDADPAPAPDRDAPGEPASRPAPKPLPPIDPADTLDPFHPKR